MQLAAEGAILKNGICPKCASYEIYHSNASPRSSDRVTLREGTFAGQDASSITRLICVKCGYLEYYLLDEGDRHAIEESWERVQPK